METIRACIGDNEKSNTLNYVSTGIGNLENTPYIVKE